MNNSLFSHIEQSLRWSPELSNVVKPAIATVLCGLFTLMSIAQAQENDTAEEAVVQSGDEINFFVDEGISQATVVNISNAMTRLQGVIHRIENTPVPSLYLIQTIGDQFVYVSEDGKHIVSGDMYQLQDESAPINLTEEKRRSVWARTLANTQTIDFSPDEGDVKYVVYAFTDITCGYCQRLHRQISTYHDLGIEIRYLAFPRSGKGSSAYQQMVSAWCSEDTKAAMTLLKNGKTIENTDCEHPIDEHMLLGQQMGLRGTPMIVLPNLSTVPGAVEAEQLLAILQQIDLDEE